MSANLISSGTTAHQKVNLRTPDVMAAVQYVRGRFAADTGEGFALACEALGAAELRPIVPNIKAPTMIVCGDQESDAFKDAARWLETNIKESRLEWMSPARHASVLEQPEAFARAARAFLGGR